MKRIIFVLVSLLFCFSLVTAASQIPWKTINIVNGGRIDAIAYLGNGIVLAGTRNPNPAMLFRSEDFGITWGEPMSISSTENRKGITCIESNGKGICYMLNESSEFFRSVDYGQTWTRITKLSDGVNKDGYAQSYGICVTKLGTVLVSETNSDGSSIYRSIDRGLSFNKIGPVSDNALYRFTVLGNSVIVNGWNGSVYRSENDGINWQRWNDLDSTALFATEYIGSGEFLQGSESGNLYLGSQYADAKPRWLTKTVEAADDFVYLGYGTIIYSTYTGSKSVYISSDKGSTWSNDGKIPTNAENDWLDHVIRIDNPDSVIVIGGTNKGYIARASFMREDLYNKTADQRNNSLVKKIEMGLIGSYSDFSELDEPEDVLIDGNYAYVPCRSSSNLAVIDISDPSKPFLAQSFRDYELIDAMGMDKHNGYIYLTSMSNHRCLVIDASDPVNLKKIYSFSIGSDVKPNNMLRKVKYNNGYLYFTRSCEGAIYIADASNPERPEIISRIETGDGAFAVYIKGDYVYSGGCPGGSLKVIDIRDKKNPLIVKTLSDPNRYGCICSFRHTKDELYAIAYSSNAFIVFDISDPINTSEISYLKSGQMAGPNRLSVIGKKGYIINSISDCLIELDVSDHLMPKINYIVPSRLLEKAYGMTEENGLLFIAGRDSRTFLIIDPQKY